MRRFPSATAGCSSDRNSLTNFWRCVSRSRSPSARGRGVCNSMISRTRVGLFDSTTVRSASCSASSMSWVTNTTVLPVSSQIRSISTRMRPRMLGSSAENGSSISTILGSTASARAIATRWRSPPDSMDGYLRASPARPDQAQQLARPRPAPLLVARAETQLRAEQHVVERGAPRNQPRRLEHERDFRPGIARRAAVDRDAPGCSLRAVRRSSAARWTCRSPKGRGCRRTRRAGRRSSAGRRSALRRTRRRHSRR